MNATDTRQLCASADLPAASSPPSLVNCIDTTADASADNDDDAGCPAVSEATESNEALLPDFPLLPVSRGFHMKLCKLLVQFDTALTAASIAAAEPHSGVSPS